MILSLNIKNYALIEDLKIDLREGLTTVTGETGAGKSIILGAISLLAGNRADRTMLKNADKKCVIEASFKVNTLNLKERFEAFDIDYEEESIIRREFNKDGKSRVFINDTPVALAHLREIMNSMLDVHSQHENLELNNKSYQLHAIDLMAGSIGTLKTYQEAFDAYKSAESKWIDLKAASLSLTENTEYLQHQLKELDEANLNEGEQEELEEEIDVLSHSEEIILNFKSIDVLLNEQEENPITILNQITSLIRTTKHHFKEMEELSDRMDHLMIELEDIRSELDRLSDRVNHDPERLQIVQDRLSIFYQLQQKFRVKSITELIEKREAIRLELSDIENIDDRLQDAENAFNEKKRIAESVASDLSKARKKVIPEMQTSILAYLNALGMSNSQFVVDIRPLEVLTKDGADDAEFLFSANKGMAARPIGKVASGGELSRLMLSIKALLTTKSALPTIIFDEIDTGISGLIAEKMGKIIRQMCGTTQVLAITHLPQIAAMGDRHLLVYKDESGAVSRTKIKELNMEERTAEVARLLSGEQISNEALQNAKVLLSATA